MHQRVPPEADALAFEELGDHHGRGFIEKSAARDTQYQLLGSPLLSQSAQFRLSLGELQLSKRRLRSP